MPQTLTGADVINRLPQDETAFYDGFIGADDTTTREAALRSNALDLRMGIFATVAAEQLQQMQIPAQLGRAAIAS
jgi:hypothetical protein